ncbi:MAG TPA: hypothetical protein VNO32_17645 [Candidatus Acidoferrum sp.]|nr:hypothetical protein [Candidatus Acidoferrum sp.]
MSVQQRFHTDAPGFVEPELEPAVEAKQRVPAFAGGCLGPVRLVDSPKRLGAEPNIIRTGFDSREAHVETVGAWEPLVDL